MIQKLSGEKTIILAFVSCNTKIHILNLHHHHHQQQHHSGVPLLHFQGLGCFNQIRNAFMSYASLVSS
jgi:hypothetical protein